MMANNFVVPPIPFFDDFVGDEKTQTGPKWDKWIVRLENMMAANNITDDGQKRSVLLHYVGEKSFEDFQLLPDTGDDYATAKTSLATHFKPQEFVEYAKAVFRAMRQEPGESIDTYYMRLKQQASMCNFGNDAAIQTELKSHIVQTCSDSKVRNKYLKPANSAKTLSDVLTDARNNELCSLQNTEIEKLLNLKLQDAPSTSNSQVVNQMSHGSNGQGRHRNYRGRSRGSSRSDRSSVKCYNCGGPYPHAGGYSACPAFKTECATCHRTGHYTQLCRSSQPKQWSGGRNNTNRNNYRGRGRSRGKSTQNRGNHQQSQNRGNYQQSQNRGNQPKTQKQFVHNVDYTEYETDYVDQDDENYLFSIIHDQEDEIDVSDKCEDYLFNVSHEMKNRLPKFMVDVQGVKIEMIADTAATCSIIDEYTFNNMLKGKTQLEVYSQSTTLIPYGSKSISTLGKFCAKIMYNGVSINENVFIVSGQSGCLLSCKASQLLKLVTIAEPNVVNSVSQMQEQIQSEFPKLFQGVGLMKDYAVKLHIDESVKPVAQPHRRIPFHLRQKVESKIQDLLKADIIEPVEGPTPWVSPIVVVPKKESNEIRICTDMRQANRAILRERHLAPTLKEIQAKLNGSVMFSKIDLRSGYNQLLLDESSRSITTFSTHVGLFRAKRLSFGISSASEIFQDAVAHTLSGLTNSINISDDIIVFGSSKAEHDRAVRQTCQRLVQNGLTANLEKCKFGLDKINFFGMIFSADGMSPDPVKVRDLQNLKPPTNLSEVRSLLGMINYSSRFIPNYATLIEPIVKLTRKTQSFQWGDEQENAFQSVVQQLSCKPVLAYYDVNRPTQILVDASPVGLAALLTQIDSDGFSHIVAYASRSLTQTERKYCQLEREALAVVWGCEYFHLHIYGKLQVEVLTDHKPLLGLFGNPNAKLSARLERWALRLQPYQPVIKYRKGSDNPADYLSRHPGTQVVNSNQETVVEEYVNMISKHAIPKAMTLEQIVRETENDPTLSLIKELIVTNRWYKINDRNVTKYLNVNYEVINSFKRIVSELCVAENGLVLRGSRIVIPKSLQEQVVNLAHEGHQGVNKTKALLREKVWFAGIDNLVQEIVSSCIACCANYDGKPREPLVMSPLPDRPWQKVSIDFYGPLPSGHYIFVILDDYSRFPEVRILSSTSANQTIDALEEIFASRGIPEVVKSDNGPPFQSAEFKAFAKSIGFTHRKVTPYWPEANGGVESFMKGLGKVTRSAQLMQKRWKSEMYQFLRNYRATPHSSTGKAPATVLNGYPLRTKLPEFSMRKDPADIQASDQNAKSKMKFHAEKRRNIVESKLNVGDKILMRHMTKTGKLVSKFDPEPYEVVDRKGSMLIVQRGEERKARNAMHCKPVLTNKQPLLFVNPHEMEDDANYSVNVPIENVQPHNEIIPPNVPPINSSIVSNVPTNVVSPRQARQSMSNSNVRPKRVTKMPKHFNEFQVNFPKKN